MPVVLAVALGGAVGAASRYGADQLISTHSAFPWSTFVVNVTGCFLVGLVVSALVDRHEAPAWLRVGLVLGFVGAYTTFSTFAQDLYDLTTARQYAEATLDLTVSVVVGVLAVVAGTALGRSF